MCNNLLPMSRRPPHELLEELLTYLQHFEQTSNLGDSASVAEIQRRLRVRIAEAEAEVKRSASGHAQKER